MGSLELQAFRDQVQHLRNPRRHFLGRMDGQLLRGVRFGQRTAFQPDDRLRVFVHMYLLDSL